MFSNIIPIGLFFILISKLNTNNIEAYFLSNFKKNIYKKEFQCLYILVYTNNFAINKNIYNYSIDLDY